MISRSSDNRPIPERNHPNRQPIVNRSALIVNPATPAGEIAQGKFPHNPNGSVLDIAGICDPTGRVFGLMPHPEAFNHWTNHPDWTRKKVLMRREGKSMNFDETLATKMFRNAVEYVEKHLS